MSLINFNENPFMALTSSFLIEKISILMVIAIILHAQKISDEINSRNTEINKRLTAEINKINSHYTAEIELINARIGIFVVEAQCILDRINNIEKVVNDLHEEKRRREEAQRADQNDTKSINSSASSYSSNIPSEGGSYNIWSRFIKIIDSIIFEKNLTLDEVCNRIANEISDSATGRICTQTVKNFYHRNSNSHIKTLDKISVWVQKKEKNE